MEYFREKTNMAVRNRAKRTSIRLIVLVLYVIWLSAIEVLSTPASSKAEKEPSPKTDGITTQITNATAMLLPLDDKIDSTTPSYTEDNSPVDSSKSGNASSVEPNPLEASSPASGIASSVEPNPLEASSPASGIASSVEPNPLEASSPASGMASSVEPNPLEASSPASGIASSVEPNPLEASSPASGNAISVEPNPLEASSPASGNASSVEPNPLEASSPASGNASSVEPNRVQAGGNTSSFEPKSLKASSQRIWLNETGENTTADQHQMNVVKEMGLTHSDGLQMDCRALSSSVTCLHSGYQVQVACIVTGKVGELTWTSHNNMCKKTIFWQIKLPRISKRHWMVSEGYILNNIVRYLFLYNDETGIEVYSPASGQSKTPVYLLYDHFWLTATCCTQPDDSSPPRIIFRYSFHPAARMPVLISRFQESHVYDKTLPLHEVYNCSYPYSVPELWKCDMVQQCLNFEDEPADCPYRNHSACGPLWAQYGDRCVHVVNGKSLKQKPADYCKSRFNAVQTPIFMESLKRFVINLVHDKLNIPLVLAFILRTIKPLSDKLAHLYRFQAQWGDEGSPVVFLNAVTRTDAGRRYVVCNFPKPTEPFTLLLESCIPPNADHYIETYVCTKPLQRHERPRGLHLGPSKHDTETDIISSALYNNKLMVALPTNWQLSVGKVCNDGSVVQPFHPCQFDVTGDTDRRQPETTLSMFPCSYGPPVHYTLVCDGLQDCLDGSDEARCSQARLNSVPDSVFVCQNLQMINSSLVCNGVPNCLDGVDEELCVKCADGMFLCKADARCVPDDITAFCPKKHYFPFSNFSKRYFFPPLVIHLDGYGIARFSGMYSNKSCEETHFLCSGGYCIPTYLLNNGEQDCPYGDDENIPTENFTCPGFYRCYGSGICVHPVYVCDGIPHCPNKDDERYCDLQCPQNCTCEGYAFTCRQMFDPLHFVQVRYLDLSGTFQPSVQDIDRIPFLRFLNLSGCSLTTLHLKDVPLLNVLDLSHNWLLGVQSLQLQGLTGLAHLNLSRNRLTSQLDGYLVSMLGHVGSLKTLTLTGVGLQVITSGALVSMKELTSLDLRDNPLRLFPWDVLRGLTKLRVLRADEARLCCQYFHTDLRLEECDAATDELSSCSDLLNSVFYRVCLWASSVLAITGNAGVIVYRLFVEKKGSSSSYRTLVINLSFSDFLMGVYIAIIGGADAAHQGVFVSKEHEWRESVVCRAAGFLGLLSSEVSAFAVCLITLDRLLVICFPFRHRLHFTRLSSLIACLAVWAVGLALAAIPLFVPSWQFYGQTGICLPLPITRVPFLGHEYAFAVFVVLNFLLFLIVGAGQAAIFCSLRTTAQATQKSNRRQEVAIARRLFLIVMTDFCCWFPIGLLALLASQNVPIPGVVNVLAAVFVLPVNSALNPFLYTLNTLLERRAQRREQKRIGAMMSNLERELQSWPPNKVEELMHYCVRRNLVDIDVVQQMMLQSLPPKYRS